MNLTGEILSDISSTGKERPWEVHKSSSMLFSESYFRLYKKNNSYLTFKNKSANISDCGSWLKFNSCPNGHEKKLNHANFCRVRLCPMCNWRRSLKFATNVKEIAHVASQRQKLRYLFLTLTVKNCEGENLDLTIKHMNESWRRLSKQKYFKDRIVGWIKVLEITRNILDGSYHPHFHIMLAVSPSYFKRDKSNSKKDKYINQEQWRNLWKKALKVDYEPVVDIRITKNKRNKENEKKLLDEGEVLSNSAISEVAKYATKSSEIITYNKYKISGNKQGYATYKPDLKSGIDEQKTDENVFLLDGVLHGKRLIAYGGFLKEIYNDLKSEDKIQDIESDDADLIHTSDDTDCKCSVCNSNMLEELYSWNYGVGHYMKKK